MSEFDGSFGVTHFAGDSQLINERALRTGSRSYEQDGPLPSQDRGEATIDMKWIEHVLQSQSYPFHVRPPLVIPIVSLLKAVGNRRAKSDGNSFRGACVILTI